jgi:hypothetical protein
MRQWVTRRALLLHLAFAAIATGCLIAAWWQIHRAMAGNTLSYLYSVEWPAFVVVAGIGWWQMVHDTPEDIARRKEHHEKARAASAEVVARTLPRSALAITVPTSDALGSERVLGPAGAGAGRAEIGAGAGAAEIGAGTAGEQVVAPGRAVPPVGLAVPESDEVMASLLADEHDAGEPADEMTVYNRYLALLAVRGKAKTWRNPHGI